MMRRGAILMCLVVAGCVGGAQPRLISIGETDRGDEQAFSGQINSLIANTGKSYVTLSVADPTSTRAQEGNPPPDVVTAASGFVIDDDGHVLTAAHVAVKKGWQIIAKGPEGQTYMGRVVDTAPEMDTALVQLNRTGDLEPVSPAPDACLASGEPVFSLGKPKKSDDTARLGSVVSMSFGRPVSYQSYGYSDAMVLRLRTRQGESGGPVFNARGELVGMLVSTLSDSAGRPLDLAHAITLPMLANFVCKNTSCSPAWQAQAGRDVGSCGIERQSPQPVRG